MRKQLVRDYITFKQKIYEGACIIKDNLPLFTLIVPFNVHNHVFHRTYHDRFVYFV